ncbi:diguanylate cyclase [Mycoplasmatota bacterium WC44]
MNTLTIVYNVAILFLLLSIIIIIQFEKLKKNYYVQFLTGIIIGLVGIAVMFNPIVITEGVIYDSRSVLIAISGAFLGVIPTFVAMIITSAFRYIAGGEGAVTGCLLIISSGFIGLLFNYFRYQKNLQNEKRRFRELYIFGILVVISDHLSFMLMPRKIAVIALSKIGIPSLLIYPLIIAFIGIYIFNLEDRVAAQSKLESSEKKYRFLSYHDSLTKLKNRRYFNEKLYELDIQENLPLSIIMADVNGLKFMNDSFGHKSGDNLLIRSAKILEEVFDENHIVSRYTGDEFIIMLPNTDSVQCEHFINKAKEKLINEAVENVQISISFGYSSKNDTKTNVNKVLKIAEDNVYREKALENPQTRAETIDTILTTLHEKDVYSEEHSERVSYLAGEIGIAMGFSANAISKLELMGLLHDIGKITISETILNKKGRLTDDEYFEMKKHSEIGFRILQSSKYFTEISDSVLKHHERWDGFGYPIGIKGEEIPLCARIISVADSYDAMTSKRSYRDSLTVDDAVKELVDNAGTQFDPRVVDVFVNVVIKKIYSSTVESECLSS